MIIRHATIDDAVGICNLCCEDLGYQCTPHLILDKIRHIDSARETVYVAEIEEHIVGFIHIEKYNTLYHDTMANIMALAVDREYRNQGIGRTLIRSAESWSNNNGISSIRLNSAANRSGAHKFYKALGYGSEKAQIRLIKNLAT